MAEENDSKIEDAFRLFWNDFSDRFPVFFKRVGDLAKASIPALVTGIVFPFPDPRSTTAVGFQLVSDLLDAAGELTSSVAVDAVISVAEAVVLSDKRSNIYNSRIIPAGDALKQGILQVLENARSQVKSPSSGAVSLVQGVASVGGLQAKIMAYLRIDVGTIFYKALKSLIRKAGFLIVQLLITVVKIGIAVGVSVIAIEIMNNAINDPKTSLFFALRQDKPKRPAKTAKRTREVSNQRRSQ